MEGVCNLLGVNFELTMCSISTDVPLCCRLSNVSFIIGQCSMRASSLQQVVICSEILFACLHHGRTGE